MIELREFQKEGVAALTERLLADVRRIVFVAATGAGKGTFAAYLLAQAYHQGESAMFIVHRWAIIKDLHQRLTDVERGMGLPAAAVGVIAGAAPHLRNPYAPIQIVSIDSLRGKANLPPAKLIIVDEAHRAASKTYRWLLEHYPNAVIVGLTATPLRLDGKGLADVFDHLHVLAQPSRLIAEGHIWASDVFTVPEEFIPDTSKVKKTGGEFNTRQLAAAANQKFLVGHIVDHWKERAEGRKTVCFAVDVEHSKSIVAAFREAGVTAEHIDGTMSNEARDAVMDRFRDDEFEVLVNCQLLVEGVDIPAIKCVILARPTESLTIYLQSVGRALRPWGTQNPIVLDHAGNARRHGLPEQDREWQLTEARQRGSGAAPTKTCKACLKVNFAGVKVCEKCGAPFAADEDEGGSIRTVEGKLIRLVPQTPAEQRAQFWAQHWAVAYERGHNLGWVTARFIEKFGEAPGPDLVIPAREVKHYTPAEKAVERKRLANIARRNGYADGWVAAAYHRKFGEPLPPAPPGPDRGGRQAIVAKTLGRAAPAPPLAGSPPPVVTPPRPLAARAGTDAPRVKGSI